MFGVYFSPHQRNIYVNTISIEHQRNYKTKTKRYTFSLNFDTDVEKSCFLCRVNIPYQQFSTFLSFMNIFRCSFKIFFKAGALQKLLNYYLLFLKKCPWYEILINFFFTTSFGETHRLMYIKSNSFVYKCVVNFQVF